MGSIKNKAEENRAEKLPQAQNILAAIPHGVAQLDTDGIILYANPAYHKIFGFQDGELDRTSILDRTTSPADRKLAHDRLIMLRNDQPAPTSFVATRGTKDGKVVTLQVDWTYNRDSDGKLVGFFAVLTDITERRRAENALRESRTTLELFINSAPLGIAIFDGEMRYTAVNEALASINGLSVEDHLGKRPHEILPGTLGLAVEQRFETLLQSN